MAHPWKHPTSGFYYVRERIPRDVLALARGSRIVLPESAGGGVISITAAAQHVKASLRTRDKREVVGRHASALAHLEKTWDGLRRGTRTLTHREAVALAGEWYREVVADHEEEPGPHEGWTLNREFLGDALLHFDRAREEYSPAEGVRALEKLIKVDSWLSERNLRLGLDSRIKFLEQAGRALWKASELLERRAKGDYSPDHFARTFPEWQEEAGKPSTPRGGSSLTELFEGWWTEAKALGRKPSTRESYKHTIENLVSFLEHDDAERVTKADVLRFKDHRLASINPRTGKPISARTVKDSDLAALKTVFGWAVANGKLTSNPAEGVTLKKTKARKLRNKWFTDEEAKEILKAALGVERGQMRLETYEAKRWVPWLMAYTGARVGEVAQLRKEDLRSEGGLIYIRITPEAGTVKNDEARNVALHPHLLELGFKEFVEGSKRGHLFLRPTKDGDVLGPLQGLKNRLAEFSRSIVKDPNVVPNHAWRDRFKFVGIESGIEHRILDAIQGHTPRTIGERDYGGVSLKAQAKALVHFPRYEVS
jgi:integrase